MPGSRANDAPPAWVLGSADAPSVEIWGLTPAERLRRSLGRAGCRAVKALDWGEAKIPQTSGSALLLRGDAIFDERLIHALVASPNTVLTAPRAEGDAWGGPVAAHVDAKRIPAALALLRDPGGAPTPRGVRLLLPGQLAPAGTAVLRKSEPPYLFPARAEDASAIEAHLFAASDKGVTDLVTRWVWPRPARAVTRGLARAGVHPNTVTAASGILAIVATVLFAGGAFALGLCVAWLMTLLDTVNGKLARVTLTSSRLGGAFDHGLALVHPPIWYLAWGLGLPSGFGMATAVVVAGYVAGRSLEALFLHAFKFETHCWRPVDALFHTISAGRNPNLILLSVGTLGGRPDLGMVMVALWTVVSLAFQGIRLL
ncbi:MAG: CDP-alcohol phosphatidyltransferase family protein, partial [Myxococcota bacterium]